MKITAFLLVCVYLFAFFQIHVFHDHDHGHSHGSEISLASNDSHHHAQSEIKEKCSICDKQIAKVFTLSFDGIITSFSQPNVFARFREYNALRIAVELRSDRGPPSC